VRRHAVLFVSCLAFAAAACGGDERAQVSRPTPRPGGGLKAPKDRLDPSRTWVARVATSRGTFTITLDARRDPRTSASFASLARRGFYDRLTFHRIVPGFVIQGGDPRGDGTGDPGYRVVEAPPPGTAYTRGVVAMAKTSQEAPGTSGSQFFVVTAEDAGLPADYAVLGRVTAGFAVVRRIEAVPTDAQERPRRPVVIRSIRVGAR
jgi:cyclophilin family peptidyl-prolyl cis-trans isomerase